MTTTLSRRILLRAAGRIHDQYMRLHRPPDLPLLPFAAWDACVRLAVLIERAQERGFLFTAQRLSRQLVRELDAFSERCRETAAVIQTADRRPAVPSLRLLYDELAALPQEFDYVEIDLSGGELVVTTDPVVLEDVHLGPFEIRFDWNDLEDPPPYRVVALQPYAAASDGETTPSPCAERTALRRRGPARPRRRPDRRTAERLLPDRGPDAADLQRRLGLCVARRLGRCPLHRLRRDGRLRRRLVLRTLLRGLLQRVLSLLRPVRPCPLLRVHRQLRHVRRDVLQPLSADVCRLSVAPLSRLSDRRPLRGMSACT